MALDFSTRRALPFIRTVWPSQYDIYTPLGERGLQDVTVKDKDGNAVKRIEVKGRDRKLADVFWGVDDFSFDNVPSPDATWESYAGGDTVSGVPADLEDCETLYMLNAETSKGFMPPSEDGQYAAKWMKVRDYDWDVVVAGSDAFWYASSSDMKERFRGYAWHEQRGTTSKSCVYGQDSEKKPRLVALFDFNGLPYATVLGKHRYLWHIYPPDYILA